MSKNFNEIVDFTICELLFDLKNESNYSNLSSLCNNLRYSFVFNTKLSNELVNIVQKIIKTLNYLYNFNEEESLTQLFNLLDTENWKKHIDFVVFMKKNLHICYI